MAGAQRKQGCWPEPLPRPLPARAGAPSPASRIRWCWSVSALGTQEDFPDNLQQTLQFLHQPPQLLSFSFMTPPD